MTSKPKALYVPVDGGFSSTELTRGPWRDDAQHGGPPAALLAHVSDRYVAAGEFLAHIEVELLRPVPIEFLTTSVTDERLSRRVHRIRAELRHGDAVVARASSLVIQRTDLPAPEWAPRDPCLSVPLGGSLPAPDFGGAGVRFHRESVEHCLIQGDFGEAGPALEWIRLRVPLVEGREPTGIERALAAADFGSGVSSVYDFDSGTALINSNLAVSFARHPQGEWVLLDSVTRVGGQGTGLCISKLSDGEGQFGVATQTLLGYAARSD